MEKAKRFEGKVVLITGAATGLGEACALRFAEEGANIICVDINETENSKTAEACSEYGVSSADIKRDVTDPTGADETISSIFLIFL